jgi:putative ATPase
VAQQYLPSSLQGRLFYQPTEMGSEKTIAQTVIKRREAFLESQQTLDETHWVQRTIGEEGSLLHQLRDALFERLELERHHNVLILGSKTGFLVWEAQRRASEGYIVAQEEEPVYIEQMKAYSASFSELRRPQFIQAPIQEISAHLQQDLVFQQIIGRNIFTNIKQAKALISVVTPYLAKGGALGTIQLIPKEGSRLSSLLKESAFGSLLEQAEKHIYENKEDTRYSWDKEMLIDTIQQSGFKVDWHPISVQQQRSIGASELSRWLKRSYIPAWNSLDLAYDEPAIYEELVALLAKAPVPWTQEHLLLVAKKRE